MPWRVALLAPLLVAVVAGAFFVPYVLRDREVVVATPQPPPRFEIAPVELEAGATACARPVPVSVDSDVLTVRGLRISGVDASPLQVTVTGPGYRVSRRFATYEDFEALTLALPDPPAELEARLCIANVGPRRAIVEGAAGLRSLGRLQTTVDGRPSDRNVVVSLRSARRQSLADRRDDVGRRAAAFKPGIVTPGLMWGLMAVLLVAVPLGAALVLRRSDQA